VNNVEVELCGRRFESTWPRWHLPPKPISTRLRSMRRLTRLRRVPWIAPVMRTREKRCGRPAITSAPQLALELPEDMPLRSMSRGLLALPTALIRAGTRPEWKGRPPCQWQTFGPAAWTPKLRIKAHDLRVYQSRYKSYDEAELNVLGSLAKSAGHLTVTQLFRLANWKSPRRAGLTKTNSLAFVP